MEASPELLQKHLGEKLLAFKNRFTAQIKQLSASETKVKNSLLAAKRNAGIKERAITKIKDTIKRNEAFIDQYKKEIDGFDIKDVKEKANLIDKLELDNSNLKLDLPEREAEFREAIDALGIENGKLEYVESLKLKTDNLHKIMESGGPVEAKKYMDVLEREFKDSKYSSVLQELPDVSQWFASMRDELKNYASHILSSKTTSVNLDSWKRLAKEYGRVSSMPDSAFKESWMKANKPAFDTFISTLPTHKADKMRAIVEGIEKRKPLTTSPKDLADRFKLPAMAVGSLAVAIPVLNWFSGSEPDKRASEIKSLSGQVDDSKVGGAGASIVQSAQKTLDDISTLYGKLNDNVTDDADATAEILQELSDKMNELSAIYKKWPEVVKNAENKSKAADIGNQIADVINQYVKKMNELGKTVGVNVVDTVSATEQSDNILKIQRFLGVNESGIVDPATVTALKRKEMEYYNKEQDPKIMGTLIDPSTNKIIEYQDLMKLDAKLR